MATTPAQIEVWLQSRTEHQRLEFKEAKTQYDNNKLFRYCVALANEGGGILRGGPAGLAGRTGPSRSDAATGSRSARHPELLRVAWTPVPDDPAGRPGATPGRATDRQDRLQLHDPADGGDPGGPPAH